MFYKQLLTVTLLSGVIISMFGCGGGDNNEATIKQSSNVPPKLNAISVALTPLSASTQTSFSQHLKNGLYLRNSQSEQPEQEINFTTSAESTLADTSSRSFSTTTIQEQGVDEADRIKYDGEYMFIAKNNYYAYQTSNLIPEEDTENLIADSSINMQENSVNTAVRVIKRTNDGEVNVLPDIVVNSDTRKIQGLYLNNKNLTVISNTEQNYHIASTQFVAEPGTYAPPEFTLTFVDVSDPENAQISNNYQFDGSIINSRRVNNILYIVSRYQPYIEQLPYAITDEEKVANYKLINNTDIANLLPKYSTSEGVTQSLVTEDQCLLPENATDKDGYDTIMTLTAININNPQQLNSVCINTSTDGIYATEKSIYVYGTHYNYDGNSDTNDETSIIHKFSINDMAINYVNSASLAGRFNWNLSNLRFSEDNNYLRVVTTEGNGRQGYEHKLNILLDANNDLSLVSQLPNAINPTPIGKVSSDGLVYEDIKAVRFFENKAYIVTFLNTDPLYVIDLNDNNNPIITAVLEIPGYSAYLHPISDSLLLGIGQNIDPNRTVFIDTPTTIDEENIEATTIAPVIEGAKVSLFDISDASAPREIHSVIYENGYTPVEYDYKALSHVITSDGKHKFSLPIERWITNTITEGNNTFMAWQPESFLSLLEVSSSQADATLTQKGNITADDENSRLGHYSSWDDRSIIHNDDVYYLHGNDIWRSYWQTPEYVTGPF